MNTGTYYLYEYKKNRRLRNAGFLKITKQYQSCFLQLNARSIPVTSKDTLKLSVFYNDNQESHALHLSDVPCCDQTISTKVTAKESQFPSQRSLDRIDGFFLVLPQGEILAAVSPDTEFDTRKIVYPSQTSETPEAFQTPQTEENELPPAEPTEDVPADSIAAEPENPVPVQIEITDTETPQVEAESPESAASEVTQAETARKIQRSELSTLPRKYWTLANNSFLLHGYYNYNHLLLVEEDGHYWLGVPGVYDPRESRAAELFGFSQFTDSYNEQLSLTKDECNDYGQFGYWCRYLK